MTIPFLVKDSRSDLHVEVGSYCYPFEIQLPSNLPTSFEHEHGQICYSINATISIPWSCDYNVKKSFTVISFSDLNLLGPELRQPYGVTDNILTGCWLCRTEPIWLKFNITKSNLFRFNKNKMLI